MKFGKLIEYNMKNICLEKSYTKCGGERGAQLGGGRGAGVFSPALFWKSNKKSPDCVKNALTWKNVHFWVKFSFQNVVLRVSRRKNSQIFPCAAFLTECF